MLELNASAQPQPSSIMADESNGAMSRINSGLAVIPPPATPIAQMTCGEANAITYPICLRPQQSEDASGMPRVMVQVPPDVSRHPSTRDGEPLELGSGVPRRG